MVPLLLLPETLRKTSPEAETLSRDTGPDDERHAEVDSTPPTPTHSAMALRLRPLVKRNVIAVPLAFFVSALGRQSTSFLLQYIRQRFNWKYEKARALIMAIIPVWCSALTNRGTFYPQASLLITVRAAINLALLLVALPALNRVLVKRKMSAQGKDLLISRLSLAFFAVGSLVISAAPIVALAALGIAIFALGYGFAPAARSLVTTFCHQDEAGLLFSALAVTQSIGGLVAGPLLTLSFRWGLSLGREWTGIPFALVAGLFACGFLAVSFVRL